MPERRTKPLENTVPVRAGDWERGRLGRRLGLKELFIYLERMM
jgi:hypothetical protein